MALAGRRGAGRGSGAGDAVTFAPAGAGEREAFGLTANPESYVPCAAIEQVMENAMAALDAGRVPVIAGPTGLGKTLVLQLLARARAAAHFGKSKSPRGAKLLAEALTTERFWGVHLRLLLSWVSCSSACNGL